MLASLPAGFAVCGSGKTLSHGRFRLKVMFFFEKKNQKTFASLGATVSTTA
jgi:hypothetical protein